jgi:alkylation response protein AidB-like acyl-CoA dehydrogenase
MEMVRHTRLDCALGSAASMRKAVAEATHHAAHRSVFGRLLIDQPLMRNVLAELCLESEAATTLAIRLAHAFDCSVLVKTHSLSSKPSFVRIYMTNGIQPVALAAFAPATAPSRSLWHNYAGADRGPDHSIRDELCKKGG